MASRWAQHKKLAGTAPRINGRQGPMEVLDLNKVPPGWQNIDFDDSAWSPTAAVFTGLHNIPWFNLSPRDIPQLAERQQPAQTIRDRGEWSGDPPPVARLGDVRKDIAWKSAANALGGLGMGKASVVNLDFGRVEAGLLELEIDAPAGGTVDVLYAEELWHRLVPRFSNSRVPCDRFVLKHGANLAAVQFGFKAFRYAQLWIWSDRPVTLKQASVRKLGYPVADVPPLRTSDELVNRTSDIATHTLRLCMQDGFLDSPSREQQQWIGDGRKQAITAFYLFGDHKLWRRLLEQIGQSQDWTGIVLPRHPGRYENIAPIPAFCLTWVSSMWDYYWFTGQDDLVTEWWPNIVQALRWFTAFERSDGLIENVPHWEFIDWGESPNGPRLDDANEGMVPALNLIYAEALECGARMAEHLGDRAAERYYAERSHRVSEEVFQTAWDAERGVVVDRVTAGRRSQVVSEPTNALALLRLAAGDPRAERIISAVFERTGETHVVKGSPNFVLETGRALARHGRAGLALQLFRERYGRMLAAGATSTWERWELFADSRTEPPLCASASHGWGAAINAFLIESVLGVEILAPGCRKLDLKPQPGLLESVDAQISTARGPLHVHWRQQGGDVELAVDAPADGMGSVYLPGGERLPLKARTRHAFRLT